MNELTVLKLDDRGREVWRYPAQMIARDASSVTLEAFFNRDDMDLGYVFFKRGDRFVETFYTDRWYNVFAVYDRDDGRLKGWYCNICRPAVMTAAAVSCDDLALDAWVAPDGAMTVLDEDEFAALDLDPGDRAQALEGMAALRALVAAAALPGWER
jgi:hypothetical protein